MDVSQNEVLKRLKALTVVMAKEGFDGFRKAFDEFCKWIDYNKWFYSNSAESNDEDCRPDSVWVLQKTGILKDILEGAKIVPLLEYLREKQSEISDRRNAVIKAIELHLVDKILDVEEIPDEIYLMLRNELDRIAESSRARDNAPIFVECGAIYSLKLQEFDKAAEMSKILKELLT